MTLPALLKTLTLPCESPGEQYGNFEIAAHSAHDSLARLRDLLSDNETRLAMKLARSSWKENREYGWEILGTASLTVDLRTRLPQDAASPALGTSEGAETICNGVEGVKIEDLDAT